MCPPLYGYVPPTKHISLMSVPYRFSNGGMVSPSQQNIIGILPPDDVDTVLARLQPGEVVIPKKHVPKIKRFLMQNKIYLPNM